MIIILRVNAPMHTAQSFKEAIAMDLEKYGPVKVLEVRPDYEKKYEQMRIQG